MDWDAHEREYCRSVEPPSFAESFDSYADACQAQDYREIMDEVGGFAPISRWEGKYWLWRAECDPEEDVSEHDGPGDAGAPRA